MTTINRGEIIKGLNALSAAEIMLLSGEKLHPVTCVDQIAGTDFQKKMSECDLGRIDWLDGRWWSTSYKGTVAKELIPLLALRDKLLSFGGKEVCLPAMEEDLDNILSRGQLWSGENAKRMRGAPSQCHRNSCLCWEQNQENTTVCTGYALSKDGIWRQHSWVVWLKPRSNQIVETTETRVAYFGFAMTHKECWKFWDENTF